MVVENDQETSRAIARKLADGHDLEVTGDPAVALERLAAARADWDVVLLDIDLPGTNGIDVLQRFRDAGSLASIVMLTGDDTTAAECMRAGAFYYLTRSFRPGELALLVEAAARDAKLRRQLHGRNAEGEATADPVIVGMSAGMRRLRAVLGRLASQDVSILIQGESGTGKELVARALHERSPRRTRPFIAFDCGALHESLLDGELFGHAEGAFTGATGDRPGAFVEADGGTLLLDEIADLPLAVQARLLRALQESEVRPVGDSGARRVDVRVLAATSVDLGAAVEQGRFRQDLYYRLNVIVLGLPPLRERLDDLSLLAAYFLRRHGGASPPCLAPEALEVMLGHGWPSNVRELEHAMRHALSLHHGEVIGPELLPAEISRRPKTTPAGELIRDDDTLLPLTMAKRRANAAYERTYLVKVMQNAKGSVSAAARLAGLDRTNFRRLLQRHRLDPTDFKN